MRRVRARRAHRKRPAEMREERRLLELVTERVEHARATGQRLIPLREVLEQVDKKTPTE